MKIAIFGTGTWALALGQVLTDNGHSVMLHGRDPLQIKSINEEHRNPKYFGNEVFFSAQITATTDIQEALSNARFVVLAVPSNALRGVLEQICGLISSKTVLVNTAKGFDVQTKKRLSILIRDFFPQRKRPGIVSLIGPSFAEEVVIRKLTLVTSTSKSKKLAHEVAHLFSNDYFRVYAQHDEVGAEIGSAMKNVIALASGIIDGLGYGNNARAALITRGLAEIVKFGTFFGGKHKTFQGLTGLGDLSLTCNSMHSRNFRAGIEIGKNDAAETFLKTHSNTVEGILATLIIHTLAKEHGLDLPIVHAVYEVLYHEGKPSEMVKRLMARPLKGE